MACAAPLNYRKIAQQSRESICIYKRTLFPVAHVGFSVYPTKMKYASAVSAEGKVNAEGQGRNKLKNQEIPKNTQNLKENDIFSEKVSEF